MISRHSGPCCACVMALRELIGPPSAALTPEMVGNGAKLFPTETYVDWEKEAQRIIGAVASRTTMSGFEIRGRSRSRDITYARHLTMYLLKEADFTVAEIGRCLGFRDHSTVLAGIKRIAGELKTRPETVADYAAVSGQAESPVAGAPAPPIQG